MIDYPWLERELKRLNAEALLTHVEMSQLLRVSTATIERTFRRLGLKSKKGQGSPMEKNYFWKGGRALDADGYMLVKVPGHPHANASGYVREHRLVMEKVLRRYLSPTEVVHHKDANKLNNVPSNLEVFPTNGDHLRKELKGRVPKWTQEGLRRMRLGNLRKVRRARSANQRELKIGVDR